MRPRLDIEVVLSEPTRTHASHVLPLGFAETCALETGPAQNIALLHTFNTQEARQGAGHLLEAQHRNGISGVNSDLLQLSWFMRRFMRRGSPGDEN
eukprot:6208128-Pleurochrysis_carterae.AAC.2